MVTQFTPIVRDDVHPVTRDREMEQRARVIEESRRWIGTPYRHCMDTLGQGVDCAMHLVRSWVDAGIVHSFDPRPYPPSWHIHQSEERYLSWVMSAAVEVPTPRPGDIVLWRFGRCLSHGGIVTRPGVVVHAVLDLGVCTESDMHEAYLEYVGRSGRPRERRYFDVWARLRVVT